MFAQSAQTAKDCERADNATYAMVAKEAETLTNAGDCVMIDSSNHYVIMYQRNTDPSKGIIFDLVNHQVFNIDTVAKSDGTPLVPEPTEGGGRRDRPFSALGALHLQDRLDVMQSRLSRLETRMASFSES
jgi:hypothetical protein